MTLSEIDRIGLQDGIGLGELLPQHYGEVVLSSGREGYQINNDMILSLIQTTRGRRLVVVSSLENPVIAKEEEEDVMLDFYRAYGSAAETHIPLSVGYDSYAVGDYVLRLVSDAGVDGETIIGVDSKVSLNIIDRSPYVDHARVLHETKNGLAPHSSKGII